MNMRQDPTPEVKENNMKHRFYVASCLLESRRWKEKTKTPTLEKLKAKTK